MPLAARSGGIPSALGLHRNVAVLAASLFGLALGEELWQVYLPAYLTALGAGGIVVGLFGSLRDFLDSAYQYPGGRLADRIGRRRTLILFTALATAGYAIYAAAPRWPLVFLGLVGVMAWKAGAFPTTFAVIGDSLPAERRAVAFGVQSVLIRLPRVASAPVGGAIIGALGLVAGMRVSFSITVGLAVVVLLVQVRGFREVAADRLAPASPGARAVVAAMPALLRRLLVAECFVRFGEGIATSFIVLFVVHGGRATAAQYGVLYALQQAVAIALYLPAGRMADLTGRSPIVALTFLFFSAFPLAVRAAGSYPQLLAAFIIGGLKEFGEPARKSLIVDLAPADRRAATVGAYYTVRNLLVVPGGLIGGWLWQRAPTLPLEIASAVSAAGLVIFIVQWRFGPAAAPPIRDRSSS